MTGIRAGVAAYNGRYLAPSELLDWDWDDYSVRLSRYQIYDAYYNNIAYSDIITWARTNLARNDLYKHVRGIYNPAARLVDIYVAKVYGGALDLEDLSTGPIPIVYTGTGDDVAFKDAVRQLWVWSNWRNQKSLYVRNGANLGDSFIMVVDDLAKQRVRMEVVNPGKCADMVTDSVGNITDITFSYYRDDDPAGAINPKKSLLGSDYDRDWLFTLNMNRDAFTATADGAEYPFFELANGDRVSSIPNPYGFVPVVQVMHKDMGLPYGANAYFAGLNKINEVNDAASLLNDNVRKSVNVQWFVTGAAAPSNSNKSITAQTSTTANSTSDNPITRKDTQDIIYGPDGATISPMVYGVDIAGAGSNIDRMLAELERDYPELALHRLRETGNATAPGVRAIYSDASDRFVEAQGNYDDGLIRAHQMGISIGGFRNYDNFQGFTLDSYARGMTDHYIKARPIIGDSLSKGERITALQQAAQTDNVGIQKLILRELDVPADEIDEITNDAVATRQQVPADQNNPNVFDLNNPQMSQPMADLQARLQRLATGAPEPNTSGLPMAVNGNGNNGA